MIKPYNSVFAELTPLLERLRFVNQEERSFGAIYDRNDGYRLTVSIERTAVGFSADLEKIGAGIRGHLWQDALMEAIEPAKGLAAAEALRNGFNEEGILKWWRIFLTFLVDNESIVFRFPATAADPHWSAYVSIYNQKVREMGIRACPEIE